MSHPKLDTETHLALIDDDPECRAIALGAIRDVFHVKPYNGHNGTGLTQEETFGLLWNFFNYCHAKKKNINPSPTPPPATVSESSDGESDTIPFSACGSTSDDKKFDMPPQF